MKNIRSLLGLCVLVLIAVTGCQKSQIQTVFDEGTYNVASDEVVVIEGKYIVQFYDGVLNESKFKADLPYLGKSELAMAEVQRVQNEILGETTAIDHAYFSGFKGFAGSLTDEMVSKLENNPKVKAVYPDIFVSLGKPDKPGKPGNGGGGDDGGSSSQETPWGIARVNGGSDATGKVAWILDTGVDQDHPDLNVNTAKSQSFLSGKQGSNPDDQNGHGTHVAGTVAAKDNSTGVIGVAANATVISVRVLDRRGNGTASGVIAGINYVGDEAASGDVANMSLSGSSYQPIDDAVSAAANASGCRFILAAGNESTNSNGSSPARVNGNNIFTVSAMTTSDNWASFSNYGNPPIDYCEPGVNIKSCWKNGGYNTISGTSMAAPHLAGILLLGSVTKDGTVNGDPDGTADPIGVH